MTGIDGPVTCMQLNAYTLIRRPRDDGTFEVGIGPDIIRPSFFEAICIELVEVEIKFWHVTPLVSFDEHRAFMFRSRQPGRKTSTRTKKGMRSAVSAIQIISNGCESYHSMLRTFPPITFG